MVVPQVGNGAHIAEAGRQSAHSGIVIFPDQVLAFQFRVHIDQGGKQEPFRYPFRFRGAFLKYVVRLKPRKFQPVIRRCFQRRLRSGTPCPQAEENQAGHYPEGEALIHRLEKRTP